LKGGCASAAISRYIASYNFTSVPACTTVASCIFIYSTLSALAFDCPPAEQKRNASNSGVEVDTGAPDPQDESKSAGPGLWVLVGSSMLSIMKDIHKYI
jgi:hypothetical protein